MASLEAGADAEGTPLNSAMAESRECQADVARDYGDDEVAAALVSVKKGAAPTAADLRGWRGTWLDTAHVLLQSKPWEKRQADAKTVKRLAESLYGKYRKPARLEAMDRAIQRAVEAFGNDQSSSINQEPTNTQGNQSLFAPSGSKLFSNPNVQNVEPAVQKPSICGGSAFSKPLESSFAAPARQCIFGGPLQHSISQPSSIPELEENTNVSQSGAFGKSQPIFGGGMNKSGDDLSGSNNVFGGTFTGSQMPSAKPTAFPDMTSPTTEPTSATKPEVEVQEPVELCVQDLTAEIDLLDLNYSEEEDRALEQRGVEEQIRAQEELGQRLLDADIERISSDSLTDLQEGVSELVSRIAQEAHSAEDLKQAQALARQEAVQICVKQHFYFWLERARRSLHRRRVMEDFPASVIPLSVKEHAERWGSAGDVQANALEIYSKRTEKSLDFSFSFKKLKAIGLRAYPQIAFAELIGDQVVHRYDTVRSKLDLRPTDKLLYKTYVSVPEDFKDSATELIDRWIRTTFKQDCTMLCDDQGKGVIRLVSGVKVTSEVAVYASLQMVRGQNPLEKQPGLVSGSSAVLFTVSPSSTLLEGKARLSALLKAMRKLPPLPLVVAVISPTEHSIDGLKQLVEELDLHQWLSLGVICDYQILQVRGLFDIKYLSEEFDKAFNYMVMNWTPSPEFSLVCFKNVLKSTFQMFYISVQFTRNSSGVYPKDIDDPRVIIGLCKEWLDHMCCEFVESYYEARLLCGDEFWPLIYDGAYLPFLNNPSYVQNLRKVILGVHLPTIEDWPPSSEADFESLIAHYCSWLGPDEKKQTIRRLSCFNGLAWPDKLKTIPWVNLIEDWMEARINYLDPCALFGTELLCLMRTPNVEHLYTYPWWAQSRYILSYLETHGFGGDCAMDVDQTVPNESLSNGDLDKSLSEDQTMVEPISAGLPQLEEVINSINELKTAQDSLLRCIQTALLDGSEDFIQLVNHSHIINNAPDLKTDAKAANSTNLQICRISNQEENVEEEEFEELEEEGEDEDLEEAMEEEREEDAESEVASEADEDSDICEVII